MFDSHVMLYYERAFGWHAVNVSRGFFHRNGEWSHVQGETMWWSNYQSLRRAVNASLGFKEVA